MSDIGYRTGREWRCAPRGSPGDYVALLKPRVMSLVVFTALTGLLLAPRPSIRCSASSRCSHRGRRGRLRRAEHVVRRRYRRADARAPPTGRFPPGGVTRRRGAGLRPRRCAVFAVFTLGLAANWLAAGAARLHHLLLRRRLYDVAEALDAAEHRDRRRRRRACRRWSAVPPRPAIVSLSSLVLFAIIFVWTPPHFWALALVKAEDYAPRRRADAAERRRARVARARNPALCAAARAARRAALCSSASPRRSMAWSALSLGALFVLLAVHRLSARRRARRCESAHAACSAFRSSIFSCCSPILVSSAPRLVSLPGRAALMRADGASPIRTADGNRLTDGSRKEPAPAQFRDRSRGRLSSC